MSENQQHNKQNQVIQAKILRRAVTILGILFPFVLAIGTKVFGCAEIQPSVLIAKATYFNGFAAAALHDRT